MESRGYFLQIASLAAITPAPMMTAYCASKSGVEAFAHSLRAEVGYKGVRVGVGYLSWTDTDMVRGRRPGRRHAGVAAAAAVAGEPTYPLGPAVDRIVAGHRAAVRACVRAVVAAGDAGAYAGYLPAVIGAVGQREMRRFEPRLEGVGKGLVGAGGAADESARGVGGAGSARGAGTQRD